MLGLSGTEVWVMLGIIAGLTFISFGLISDVVLKDRGFGKFGNAFFALIGMGFGAGFRYGITHLFS